MSNTQDSKEDIKSKAKSKPDFFAREITTSGKDPIQDIYQHDENVEDYVIHSKDKYLENENAQKAFKASGIKDFDTFYEVSKNKLEVLKSIKDGVQFSNRAPVLDTPLTRFMGWDITDDRVTNSKAHIDETKLLKHYTPQEIAQEVGEIRKDGSRDTTGDDSAWETLTGTKNLRLARSVDPDTNQFSFNRSERGLYNLEEYDPTKASHTQDQKLGVWNTGIWKDSWMDGNQVDEPIGAVLMRYSPQIAAGALAVATGGSSLALTALAVSPFFSDIASGSAGVYKSVATLFGDETDADFKKINQFQNSLDKFDYDISQDQQENPFGLKSIVGFGAQVYGQLAGMGAISSGAFKGMNAITAALNGGKAASKSSQAVASFLSTQSMGISAAEDFKKIALESGIDEDDASGMHIGLAGILGQVAKISDKIFSPVNKKLNKKVVNNVARNELMSLKPLIEKYGGKLPDTAKKSFLNRVATGVLKTTKKLDEAVKKGGSSSTWVQTFLGAGTEGLEEVSELGAEELMKSVYNKLNKDKKQMQGRFQDFDLDAFLREAGHSFVYGAVAGGVMGTKVGKKALGMKDQRDIHSLTTYTLDEQGEKDINEAIEEVASTDTKYSYAKDAEGNHLEVDKDSADTLRHFSKRDMDIRMAKEQFRYLKDHVQYKIGRNQDKGAKLDDILDEKFQKRINPDRTSIKKDIVDIVSEDFHESLELETLQNQKAELEENKRSKEEIDKIDDKIKKTQKSVDERNERLDQIISGKFVNDYITEAIYKSETEGKDFMSMQEFNEANEAIRNLTERSNTLFEESSKEIQEISSKILKETNPLNIVGHVQSTKGRLTKEAINHINRIFEDGTAKKEVKDIVEADLISKISSNEKLTPEQSKVEIEDAVELLNRVYEETENKSLTSFIQSFKGDDYLSDIEEKNLFSLLSAEGRGLINLAKTIDPKSNSSIKIKEHSKINSLVHYFKSDEGESFEKMMEDSKTSTDSSVFLNIGKQIGRRLQQLEATAGMYPQLMIDTDTGSKIQSPIPKIIDIPNGDISREEKEVLITQAIGGITVAMNGLEDLLKQARDKFSELKEKEKDPVDFSQANQTKAVMTTLDKIDKLLLPSIKSLGEYPEIEKAGVALTASINSITDFHDSFFKEKGDRSEISKEDRVSFFNELMVQFYTFNSEVKSVLKQINSSQKAKNSFAEDIRSVSKGKEGGREVLSIIRTAELLDFKKAFSSMNDILADDNQLAPTWEQQTAILETLSSVLPRMDGSNKGSLDEFITEHTYKRLNTVGKELKPNPGYKNMKKDNLFFLQGTAGSGKTSMVAGNVFKILQSTMKSMGHDMDILATGHVKKKQDHYIEALKKKDLNVKNLDEHMTLDRIVSMLDNGDKKLSNTGIITYDEATFINGNGIEVILDKLSQYNKTNRKNRPPLQIMLVGDPNQGGAYTSTGNAVVSHNIGSPGMELIHKNTGLSVSQRAGYSSLTGIQTKLEEHSSNNMEISKGIKLETTHGKGEKGEPAGVEFTQEQDRKDAIIQEMLESEGDFYYVTDRDPKVDKEYKRLVKKFPELKANTFSPVSDVQGDEAPFIYYDIKDTSKQSSSKEQVFIKDMYMVFSRAKNKVAMSVNSKDRDWTSEGNITQTASGNNITKSKYKEVRESMIGSLTHLVNNIPGEDATPGPENTSNEGTGSEVKYDKLEIIEDERSRALDSIKVDEEGNHIISFQFSGRNVTSTHRSREEAVVYLENEYRDAILEEELENDLLNQGGILTPSEIKEAGGRLIDYENFLSYNSDNTNRDTLEYFKRYLESTRKKVETEPEGSGQSISPKMYTPKKEKKNLIVVKENLRKEGYSFYEFKFPKGKVNYTIITKPGSDTEVLNDKGQIITGKRAIRIKEELSNSTTYVSAKADMHLKDSSDIDSFNKIIKMFYEEVEKAQSNQGAQEFNVTSIISEYIGDSRIKSDTDGIELDSPGLKKWIDGRASMTYHNIVEHVQETFPNMEESDIKGEINEYLNRYDSRKDFLDNGLTDFEVAIENIHIEMENLIGVRIPTSPTAIDALIDSANNKEFLINEQIEQEGAEVTLSSVFEDIEKLYSIYDSMGDVSFNKFKKSIQESSEYIKEVINESIPENQIDAVRQMIEKNDSLSFLKIEGNEEYYRDLHDAIMYGKKVPEGMRHEDAISGSIGEQIISYLKEDKMSPNQVIKIIQDQYKEFPYDGRKVISYIESSHIKLKQELKNEGKKERYTGEPVVKKEAKISETPVDNATASAIIDSSKSGSKVIATDPRLKELLADFDFDAFDTYDFYLADNNRIIMVDRGQPSGEKQSVNITGQMKKLLRENHSSIAKPESVKGKSISIKKLKEKTNSKKGVYVSNTIYLTKDKNSAVYSQVGPGNKHTDAELGRGFVVVGTSQDAVDEFHSKVEERRSINPRDLDSITIIPLSYTGMSIDSLRTSLEELSKLNDLREKDVRTVLNYTMEKGEMVGPRKFLAKGLKKHGQYSRNKGASNEYLQVLGDIINILENVDYKPTDIPKALSVKFNQLMETSPKRYRNLVSLFKNETSGILVSSMENNTNKQEGDRDIKNREVYTAYKGNAVVDLEEFMITEGVEAVTANMSVPLTEAFISQIQVKQEKIQKMRKENQKFSEDPRGPVEAKQSKDKKEITNNILNIEGITTEDVSLLQQSVNVLSSPESSKEERVDALKKRMEIKSKLKETGMSDGDIDTIMDKIENC